jgi:glyoxylase-like metal-dependent hydrolase (beta-lactamase superfamily II)
VILLNSHGHLDHMGNNDVAQELGASSVRHLVPHDAREALDFEPYFLRMYKRGLPYFDYLDGLALNPDDVASLLRALDADQHLSGDDVADLGRLIAKLGITPAISGFVPSMVVDILLQTYPAIHPNFEAMVDYEQALGVAGAIRIGSTSWRGWTFSTQDGMPEVQVLQSAGHSAGGLVFYLPEPKFLMLADETTTVPIWADTNPRNCMATMRKAVELLDNGDVETICAGHRPLLPLSGDEAKKAMESAVASGAEFEEVVHGALARTEQGLSIDQLYGLLVSEAPPESAVAMLAKLQFPVFSTFLKLTLLNHCLLQGLPQGAGIDGRPTFRAV